MKKYKRSATMNFFFGMTEMMYLLFWGFIPLSIMFSKIERLVSLGLLVACFALVGFYAILCIAIELIASIFIKRHVLIEDDYITWRRKKIRSDSVNRIIFDIGTIGKMSQREASLTLIDFEGKITMIERPPYLLLFNITKICKNATFELENWKKKILIYPIFAFLGGVAVCVIILLSNK